MTVDDKKITMLQIILIAIFAIVSVFGCFEIRTIYMIDYDFFKAGEYSISHTQTNCALITVPLSLIQGLFIISKRNKLDIVCTIISIISFLLTILHCPVCNLVSNSLMGGITYDKCAFSILGYVVVFISAVNLLIQIVFMKKRRKKLCH